MTISSFDIRIESGDVLLRDPVWQWRHAGTESDKFVFWIIREGKGSILSGDNQLPLAAGDCLILHMWEKNVGAQGPDDLLHIPWFVYEYIDKATGRPLRPNPLPAKHRCMEQFGFLETLMDRAMADWRAHKSSADDWLKACLLEVARQDEFAHYQEAQVDQYHRVMAIVERMRQAPGSAFPLKAIARQLFCTPDHAIRLFKKHCSVTPAEMLIRLRMERARHLLRFSSMSITRIADNLGYKEIAFFSRQFSQRIGMSPRAFRETG